MALFKTKAEFEAWAKQKGITVITSSSGINTGRLKPATQSQPAVVVRPLPRGDRENRTIIVPGEPVPAPRMTRQDKWMNPRRPCVQQYFDYRDNIRAHAGDIPVVPDEVHCQFYIPMPESWSKKKRQAMDGQPHRQRPDIDNCFKGVCDALFLEDGAVWKGSQEKRWCRTGSERTEITLIYTAIP